MKTAILREEGCDESDFEEEDSEVRVHGPRRLQSGEHIGGKYLIRGVLGTGGFAVVYDAEHVGLRRSVAIKVMHLDIETPLALVDRFRNEARISAVVRHHNVLEVYDTGALEDGSPYLVMERINGGTLFERMSHGRLPLAAVVDFARQLLVALSALCDRGIVHRDIKPENVMLHDAGDGRTVVKVVDFGISKSLLPELEPRLTSRGCLLGTPQYMSPEQIRGEDIDVRTDIYAVGVMLYEALTGCLPHEGTTLNELVLSALNNQPRGIHELNPDCPHELARIAHKALSSNREDRYATPRDMLRELESYISACSLPEGDAAWRLPSAVPAVTPARSSDAPIERKSGVLFVGLRVQRKHAFSFGAVVMTIGLCTLGKLALDVGDTRAQATRASAAWRATYVKPETTRYPEAEMVSAQPPMLVQALAVESVTVPSAAGVGPAVTTSPAPEPSVAEPGRPRDHARREPRLGGSKLSASSAIEPVRPNAASQLVTRAPLTASTSAHEAPTNTALLRDALAAYVVGRLPDAEELYQKAVQQSPRNASAWRGLGLVAARRGHSADARRALKHYLELAPNSADAPAIRSRLAALH